MLYLKQIILSLAAAFFIVACGGSGGGGASKATVTADNAKSLAIAGTEAVKSASESDGIPLLKSGTSNGFDVQSFSKQLARQAYAAADASLCDSGRAVLTVSDASTNANPAGSMVYTNCAVSVGSSLVSIDGTVIFSGSQTSISINANLTVTENEVSETVSFNATCGASGGKLIANSCTFSVSITGIDGRTYNASNLKVSGNDSSGYTISGSVTDPDFGTVTLTTTTPVTFTCANGNPKSGKILVSGEGSAATVTFNDCNGFTVTFNGAPTQYNWADI